MAKILQNRYQLQRALGQGGFSEVWLALDTYTNQQVAVKVALRHDESGIQLFRKEYERTNGLNHPNIIHFTDYGVDGGRIPFLVMPFYKNGSPIQRAGKLEEVEVWRLIRDIASALEYIHHLDILHYDLKPDNFLEDAEGRFILTDFGISVRLSADGDIADGLTPSDYRAPELFDFGSAPKEQPFKLSEIWAFGACLYELVQGEPPFDSQGGLQQRLLHASGQGNIREVLEPIPDKYSGALFQVIASCLEYERWSRPKAEKIKEMALQYLQSFGQSDITTPNSGYWQHQSAPPPPQPAAPGPTEPTSMPRRYASSKSRPISTDEPAGGVVWRSWMSVTLAVFLTAFGYYALDKWVFHDMDEQYEQGGVGKPEPKKDVKNPAEEDDEPYTGTVQDKGSNLPVGPSKKSSTPVNSNATEQPVNGLSPFPPSKTLQSQTSSNHKSEPNNPPAPSGAIGRANYAGAFHIVLGPVKGESQAQEMLTELNTAFDGEYSFWGEPAGFGRYTLKVNKSGGFTDMEEVRVFQQNFVKKYQDEESPVELTANTVKRNKR